MKQVFAVLVGLAVALALLVPLAMVSMAPSHLPAPILRVADEPTPTPTPGGIGGQSGCHGGGC